VLSKYDAAMMRRAMVLVAALSVAFWASMSTAQAEMDHEHSSNLELHSLPPNEAPSVTITASKDPTGGFNVHIVTRRFSWTPEQVSSAYAPGGGHAHLYLEGVKIGRVYGPWFHVNTAQFATHSGEQLVSVELVGNDHVPYATGGVPVRGEVIVDVPASEVLMRGNVAGGTELALELRAAEDEDDGLPWPWGLAALALVIGGLLIGRHSARRAGQTSVDASRSASSRSAASAGSAGKTHLR